MTNNDNQLIYKIEDHKIWDDALQAGEYHGAPIDVADGFIHFSTANQSRETAAKHFTGRAGLIIATIDSHKLGDGLKWEVSRGGALFPHYYGVLDMRAVTETKQLKLDENGAHIFPDNFPK